MVNHIPHLYLPGPYEAPVIPLPEEKSLHIRRVLRRGDGSPVEYTDGLGLKGEGKLTQEGIERGVETISNPSLRSLSVAVAPPENRDRARFIVEKLGELGIDRLIWIRTCYGQGKPPRIEKARAWAESALEQSRGDRILEITEGDLGSLDGLVLVADPNGGELPVWSEDTILVVGPEGGWSPGEVDPFPKFCLGDRILRTETAAIVAAGVFMANGPS